MLGILVKWRFACHGLAVVFLCYISMLTSLMAQKYYIIAVSCLKPLHHSVQDTSLSLTHESIGSEKGQLPLERIQSHTFAPRDASGALKRSRQTLKPYKRRS